MELSHISLSLSFISDAMSGDYHSILTTEINSCPVANVIAVRIGAKEWQQSARSSGILSSRSRTPLPKLMQSCQSFYAICNRIFPFDDEPVRCSTSVVLFFPPLPPNPRRLPIDSTCLRLKKVLSFLRLFLRFVSFYPCPSFFAFFALRRKVSRDFFSFPFFHPTPRFPPSILRFRRVSIQRAQSFF